MKVYVIVVESSYWGSRSQDVTCYLSLKDAQAKLEEERRNALSDVSADDICECTNPEADNKKYNCEPFDGTSMSWSMWKTGEYDIDHTSISVTETEVI